MLAVLLGAAFCVELYLQNQKDTMFMSRSWKDEDIRIKYNNKTKLAGLDEFFPLMATSGGIVPMQSGKAHRIVVIADSFSWGDGLADLNDVWWRQIERELIRRGYHDVEVVAFGWNGAQTKEYLAWLRDARFKQLKAEAIVLGYVVNDPDMGVYPQNYKVHRMFFVDDVFRWFLPELVEQFQARYMNKEQARIAKKGVEYGPEEWLKLLLDGENFSLWKKTVADLAQTLKAQGVPYAIFTLPVAPDKAYYEPLYEKPMRVIKESGIPLVNILDEYVRAMEKEPTSSPYHFMANPANGHPGPIATFYYAKRVADWLEKNAPHALGEKSPSHSEKIRVNDWYPWKSQARFDGDAKLQLQLPSFREMGVLPVGKPHVLFAFENPVELRRLTVTSPDAQIAEVYVSIVDGNGHNDLSLHPCRKEGAAFVVPDLPEGARVNAVRIVPAVENRTLTATLEIKRSVAP